VRRREVIGLLVGALASPLAAVVLRPATVAQERARRIAILGPAEEPRFSQIAAGLERGLRDQGLSPEGVNILKERVERGDHEAARRAVSGWEPEAVSFFTRPPTTRRALSFSADTTVWTDTS
jgi:hypothetical protein